MKISILGFAASLLFTTLISNQPLSTIYLSDHNISITLSENKTDMTIKAKFPSSKTLLVESSLVNYFKLDKNLDLRSAQITLNQKYEKQSLFQVQSKPGRLTMMMSKADNPSSALFQFKAYGEKLKSVLAD